MQERVVYLTAVRFTNFPSISKGRAYFVKPSACSGKQRYPHERAARARQRIRKRVRAKVGFVASARLPVYRKIVRRVAS